MGRHSLPDPEDSADEPPDEYAAEQQDWADQIADQPGGGRHSEVGYPGSAEPSAVEPPSGRGYADRAYWSEGDLSDGAHYAGAGDHAADYSADGADEYPDFGSGPAGEEPPSPESAAAPPPPFRTAGHRGLGNWQGGHRSADGWRGVSIGVIVALVAVVVVVAGVIVWRFFGEALYHRSRTAAARCVGGKDTVAVIADPTIAERVNEFADSYNASAGPVGDKCVTVAVKAADSDAVIAGSSVNGHPNWVASRGCGSPAAPSLQRACPRPPVSRPSATAVHWRPHQFCSLSAPSYSSRCQTRTGQRYRSCRPTRTRWPR